MKTKTKTTWRTMKLGEVMKTARVEYEKIKTSEYQKTGQLPIFDQGSDNVAGYTDNLKAEYRGKFPAILFGDHTLKLKLAEKPFAVGADGIQILEPDESLLDRKFFYYALKGSKIRSYGYERHMKYLRELTVAIPTTSEQKCIAGILSAFDEKIENNNRIMKTLEEIAQVIFKEWFIHFRFPGHEKAEFLDSIQGQIPQEWRICQLEDIFSFVKGKKPVETSNEFQEKFLPLILIDTFDSGVTTYANTSEMVISSEEDLLMVMDGASSGRIEFGMNGVVGSTISKLRMKRPVKSILYFFLKSREKSIRENTTGSAIPHTDKDKVYSYELILPEDTKDLEDDLHAYIEKIRHIKQENHKLDAIRDLLLPKLMSGEIRV